MCLWPWEGVFLGTAARAQIQVTNHVPQLSGDVFLDPLFGPDSGPLCGVLVAFRRQRHGFRRLRHLLPVHCVPTFPFLSFFDSRRAQVLPNSRPRSVALLRSLTAVRLPSQPQCPQGFGELACSAPCRQLAVGVPVAVGLPPRASTPAASAAARSSPR